MNRVTPLGKKGDLFLLATVAWEVSLFIHTGPFQMVQDFNSSTV